MHILINHRDRNVSFHQSHAFSRSADDLAYLDLEAGHNRLARLSFCGQSPVPQIPALSREVSKSSFSSSGSDSRYIKCNQIKLSVNAETLMPININFGK